MKTRKCKPLGQLLFSLFILLSCFSFQSSVYAASIGSKLPTAEAGWQRVIDTNPLITYEGTWTTYTNSIYSTGSAHAATANGSVAKFWFEGTKIRVIGSYNTNKSSIMSIKIDDLSYTFSAFGQTEADILLFEKTGLANKGHQVIITYIKDAISTDFVLSGIDIDGNLTAPPLKVTNLTANPDNINKNINLTWNSVANASYYNVLRSESPGGPFSLIASKLTNTVYSDSSVAIGTKYYYVVTAANSVSESTYSNEASASLSLVGRAILNITLETGMDKEFDLSMEEVNSFISWYENRALGVGPAAYGIDKHDNNRGPFKNRKDYLVYDKILSFEVSEYELQ